MCADPPPFRETWRPGGVWLIAALFGGVPPGRPLFVAPGLPAVFVVPGRPFAPPAFVFGRPFVLVLGRPFVLVLGRPFVVVFGRPVVLVLGRPFVVVPGRPFVVVPALLPGRPGDAVLVWPVDPCVGRLGLCAWLGAEVCAGALACGAGALGFGGALGVFFWPHASAGTVITSKKRIDFRRALPFTMNFIAHSSTEKSFHPVANAQRYSSIRGRSMFQSVFWGPWRKDRQDANAAHRMCQLASRGGATLPKPGVRRNCFLGFPRLPWNRCLL
jgi:hypothetical protein